jgi:hypothetical protein
VGCARGNRGHRAAWACVGGVCIVAGSACQKDPVITDRAVTLHAPQNCAPGLANLDVNAFAVYHALGDYEPVAPSDGHLLESVGTALPEIDPAVRALTVDATGASDRLWQGATPVAASGPVDVLVLPSTTPCSLRGPVVAPAGATIGMTGSQQMLLLGGSVGSAGAPDAVSLRLDTGAMAALPPARSGARTDATVTPFGDGALLAGGKSASGGVLGDAQVYDPALGAFDSKLTIPLGGPRADAGAGVLATGETLLAGGVGGDGTLLDTMEIIDPVTRKARTAAARLNVARRAPTVLRLASGEVFVAGGFDATGASVAMLEWFLPDASQIARQPETLVEFASSRAYAALQAGGVLAVFAQANAPSTFQNTWVIGPDGGLDAATPVEGALVQPVLFGGAGGAPVLWTGSSPGAPGGAGVPGRWLRWQPWTGAFAALDVLDDPGRIVGTGTAASADPGTALWLDVTNPAAPKLAALRFDVRGEYSTLAGPLLVTDANDVAPDRLATGGMVSFDPSQGLILMSGASADQKGGSAFVTDRTYADVRIEVDAPTGQPALVVLSDGLGHEMEVGGAACPGAVVTGAASSLTIERKGASLTWALAAGGGSHACALGFAADARVSVGVRASPDLKTSVARNLRVTRLGKP